MSTDPTVIVAGARTPMGRMSGSLKGFSGSDLGGFAIKGALDKAGVAPQDVDYVIMGQVLTAGEGQIPARQAAVAKIRDAQMQKIPYMLVIGEKEASSGTVTVRKRTGGDQATEGEFADGGVSRRLFDVEVAHRYRDRVLDRGGSADAAERRKWLTRSFGISKVV